MFGGENKRKIQKEAAMAYAFLLVSQLFLHMTSFLCSLLLHLEENKQQS